MKQLLWTEPFGLHFVISRESPCNRASFAVRKGKTGCGSQVFAILKFGRLWVNSPDFRLARQGRNSSRLRCRWLLSWPILTASLQQTPTSSGENTCWAMPWSEVRPAKFVKQTKAKHLKQARNRLLKPT